MQEEKSLVYTLVLGICMLLCLLMIGRMMLGHPEAERQAGQSGTDAGEQEETQMGMQFSEEDLQELMVQALPFSPTDFTVRIGEDGTISITAEVRRQDLADSGLVPGNLRTALLFLPESCKISGAWTVALEDNGVTMQCRRVEIAGIDLPDEAAATLSEQIGSAIDRYLSERQITPSELQWEDGKLSLIV